MAPSKHDQKIMGFLLDLKKRREAIRMREMAQHRRTMAQNLQHQEEILEALKANRAAWAEANRHPFEAEKGAIESGIQNHYNQHARLEARQISDRAALQEAWLNLDEKIKALEVELKKNRAGQEKFRHILGDRHGD